jgi:hypothetical protein
MYERSAEPEKTKAKIAQMKYLFGCNTFLS